MPFLVWALPILALSTLLDYSIACSDNNNTVHCTFKLLLLQPIGLEVNVKWQQWALKLHINCRIFLRMNKRMIHGFLGFRTNFWRVLQKFLNQIQCWNKFPWLSVHYDFRSLTFTWHGNLSLKEPLTKWTWRSHENFLHKFPSLFVWYSCDIAFRWRTQVIDDQE